MSEHIYDDDVARERYGARVDILPSCQKCGGGTHTSHYAPDECSAGCDTSVERCDECAWEGEPE